MILAIDVGGTKTLVATFSSEGKKITTLKLKTPQEYPEFIKALRKSIKAVVGNKHPKSCGIALPGSIDRDNGIIESLGNLPWKNVPIRQDLQATLDCPIVIENDAKAAALSEAKIVESDYTRVLYVTISTGIGLGMVIDGVLDHSIHDAGGNAIKLEHDGRIQSWEEFASGKALLARTGKLASELEDPKEWYVVARNIALGLIDVITLVTPECIVIGGGVGAHLSKFQEKLENELSIFSSRMIEDLPDILPARNPEEAVIYGCYLLARNNKSSKN